MTDQKIIEMLFCRDQDALTVIEQKYGDYCRAVAMNILNDSRDAEECMNDALLAVWNHIPPDRPEEFGGYLARIIRNAALDRLRKSGADRRDCNVTALISELEECLPGEPSAEDRYLGFELSDALKRFLNTVSKKEKDVFVARYFSGFDTNRIAEAFHTSGDYVRTMLKRTRKKLKKFLQKENLL